MMIYGGIVDVVEDKERKRLTCVQIGRQITIA